MRARIAGRVGEVEPSGQPQDAFRSASDVDAMTRGKRSRMRHVVAASVSWSIVALVLAEQRKTSRKSLGFRDSRDRRLLVIGKEELDETLGARWGGTGKSGFGVRS